MFNRNMVELIKIFNKHPYMFVNFLNKHDAFNENFKNTLTRIVLKQKPHFNDLDKMIDYYIHLLDTTEVSKKDKIMEWNTKLSVAISEQRYEDAAKIRDHMNKKGYNIFI